MNDKATNTNANLTAWGLSTLVAALAVTVWGSNLGWQFAGLSPYALFPLFGLLAFSVMWSHYVIAFLNRVAFKGAELGLYYKVTGYVVLVAILLHPGVLAYQRFKDGFGLPLGSLTGYVQPSLRWVVLLGTVSFFTFLAFELHRWYADKSWWRYVVYANDVAMLAIFYHGLRLGSNLHGGWYQYVWYIYGIGLVAVLLHKYSQVITKYRSRKPT
jgi:hypothetical protein